MHADTALTAYDKGLKLELRDKITAGAEDGSALTELERTAVGDELDANDGSAPENDQGEIGANDGVAVGNDEGDDLEANDRSALADEDGIIDS